MDYYDEVEPQAGVPGEDVKLWNLKRIANVVKKAMRFLEDNGKVCMRENESFKLVCLAMEVLRTTLHALNNLRGDNIIISNKTFRYAGYRQYTCWVHNKLGRGMRKVML